MNERPLRSFLVRTGLFGLVLFLVLFPRVDLFVTLVTRPLDPNAMVDPGSAALAPLEAEFDETRDPDWDRVELLKHLERYVYARIPYAFDWVVWGNVHYQPTVEETLEAGREDCDGQAIVAASLMRRYGYEANIVGNLAHVWVATDVGETMSPLGAKLVDVDDGGRTQVNWRSLTSIPRDTCFGIFLFPLSRELVLAVAAWLLFLRPGVKGLRAMLALGAVVLGLLIVRQAGDRAGGQPVDLALGLAGFALWLGALWGLVFVPRRGPA